MHGKVINSFLKKTLGLFKSDKEDCIASAKFNRPSAMPEGIACIEPPQKTHDLKQTFPPLPLPLPTRSCATQVRALPRTHTHTHPTTHARNHPHTHTPTRTPTHARTHTSTHIPTRTHPSALSAVSRGNQGNPAARERTPPRAGNPSRLPYCRPSVS